MAARLKGMGQKKYRNGFKVTCHPEVLDIPLKWKKPRRIFVNSMSDLFHPDVPFEFILKVFDRMEQAKQHSFLILTKRPLRMLEFCGKYGIGDFNEWPENIMPGVSVENQETADERIPLLLQTPAPKRFVSVEPMLGAVDLEKASCQFGCYRCLEGLDWVVLGGESGKGARPMHTAWVRKVRDDCQAAGVPFFFKQWGEWIPKIWLTEKEQEKYRNRPWGTLDIDGNWFPATTPWNGRQGDNSKTREYVMVRVGKKAAGALLDGVEHRELIR